MKTICALMLLAAGLTTGAARADSPKGYRVVLTESKIGGLNVEAGEYRLLVHPDEQKIQLVPRKGGDPIDVAGKVENADVKYQNTEVRSQSTGGVHEIVEIRIGGTKLRVNFRPES